MNISTTIARVGRYVLPAFLLLGAHVASAAPNCASAASDPDGDGWGWENNQSCIVVVIPNCASAASDPDGDGWGWENNKSCKVVAQTTVPNCASSASDPDGDGWGWENNKSCKVVTQTTIPNCASSASDPDGDGWGWENNQSCKVVASNNGSPNCTTTTSDPDGDGFGWENNKTCAVLNRTGMQITGDMGTGWNLGNTLDSFGGETNWGNPKTTKAMIDKIRSGGFKTLRVPVTWDDHMSGGNHTINSSWMDRVEEVVNYGLANDMYVIINVHHNNGWEAPTYGNESNAKYYLTQIWQQVSARFNKYGDKVIFETMNEPRNGDDWTGKAEYYDVINRLNAAAVSAIRNTGGNNAKRLVMIPGYAAAADDTKINAIVIPSNGGKIAISTHAYFPFGFALDSTGTSYFGDTSEIDNLFSRLNNKFISKGIPVVMGEWASTNKNNLSDRVRHAEYYVKKAKSVKIPTVWWDNNSTPAWGSDAMGLLNRSNNSWYFPTIVTAIMNGNK